MQVDPYFFYLGGSYTRFFVDVEGLSSLYEVQLFLPNGLLYADFLRSRLHVRCFVVFFGL